MKQRKDISPMIQLAIRDIVRKALKAKPVKVHIGQENPITGYVMDGEVYSEEQAIQHILGEYCWSGYERER